jgi:Tfp pilus assembly protein PilE
MKTERKEFTFVQCLLVVAILLFVTVVAARAFFHSVRVSEENAVRSVRMEYSTVRNMYAEEYPEVPTDTIRVETANASFVPNTRSR